MSSFLFDSRYSHITISQRENDSSHDVIILLTHIHLRLSSKCVYVRRSSLCLYLYMCISVYESIHTGVEHDNNVDDLLIVHIHRHQLLSKRKRRGEKKKKHTHTYDGYSDVSSVCPFSLGVFFSSMFYSLSSVVA